MDGKRIRTHQGISWAVGRVLGLLILCAFTGPVSASGPSYPEFLYMPEDVQKYTHQLWYDPADYYAYLFGNQLNIFAFYPAWRSFEGKPLGAAETGAMRVMFSTNGDYGSIRASSSEQFGVDDWLKDRNEVMGDGFSYGENARGERYRVDDANCGGFFDAAVRRLRDRRSRYSDEELKRWIQNQDAANAHCMVTWDRGGYVTAADLRQLGGVTASQEKVGMFGRIWRWIAGLFSEDESAPGLTNDDSGPLRYSGSDEFLADQEYQYAVSQNWSSEASNIFKRISENLDSSYRNVAKIMFLEAELRALIGRGSERRSTQACPTCYSYTKSVNILNTKSDLVRGGRELLAQLNDAIRDPELSDYRGTLKVKKERLLARLYDPDAMREAEAVLDDEKPGELLHSIAIVAQQLELLEHDLASTSFDFAPQDHSEFVQFVWAWHHPKGKSSPSIAELWAPKASTTQPAWIVAALWEWWQRDLTVVPGYIKDAAFAISPTNRLFYPAMYYLAIAHWSDAKPSPISAVLKAGTIPDVAYNFIREYQMRGATTLAEATWLMDRRYLFYYNGDPENRFIRTSGSTYAVALTATAPRIDWYYPEYRDWFLSHGRYFTNTKANTLRDDNLIWHMNYLVPLDELLAASRIRADYLPKLFTRAFLLNRADVYRSMLTELSDDQTLALATQATDDVTQRFLIVLALMRDWRLDSEDRFGVVIHNNNMERSNDLNDWGGRFYRYDYESKEFIEQFPWKRAELHDRIDLKRSDEQVARNDKEKEVIYLNSLVESMAKTIFAYAQQNPDDIRIAEALHELTLFGRYHGRADGDWPKKVFQLLHRDYPNTTWAKNTPYHY